MESSIRRELNGTTAAISALLTKYSKLAQQASTSYSSSGLIKDEVARQKKDLEEEVDEALKTFSAQIERLVSHHATAHPPPSASATHALERHRETRDEYQRDYARTKASLKEAEQRANLLGSVREEISAFKSSSNSSTTDSLLSERNRIDHSHRMTDDVLGQAYETRAAFAQQRRHITGIGARMNGVIAAVPALNSLVGMINSRRRRDSLILGSVIGLCVVFILWYLFG